MIEKVKYRLRLLVFCSLILLTRSHCSIDEEPFRLFGEKTFYEHVGGKLPTLEERAPEFCQPIHINMLIRHGARYPNSEDSFPALLELFKLARKINITGTATQCPKDIKALLNWKVWATIYDNRNVTREGAKEISDLAFRFKQAFPEILNKDIPANQFWFSSTDKPQTRQSLSPFKTEILKDDEDQFRTENRLHEAQEVIPRLKDDHIFHKNCEKYMVRVSRNVSATPEFKAFLNGPLVEGIVKGITRRLGFPKGAIDRSVVWKMYTIGCYYQQWVDNENGPWCAAFTREELEILSFAEDIRNYEMKSRKISISYEKNCFVSKEIMSSLLDSRTEDMLDQPHLAGRFRLVHTSNIVTTVANFRLYEVDEPLTSQNFESKRNREFSFAKMVPTAANLVFVLYRCDDPSLAVDYKVQVLWNENVVPVPGCPQEGTVGQLCDLDEFMRIYPTFVVGSLHECDQDEICRLP
ncbi:unnamed protein product [Clavelina lepadiformis]|uniref:Multiple inositol polyphosphate phosphatase 1 n=1 Tax=Clavelina lepadiformis TaxID=159417 RepID=A0ABP0GUR3_CLALP